MIQARYERNMTAFSAGELALIRQKRVLVVGCGGLGGQVVQSLARFGVGALTLVDGDDFSESNLNRQVFATAHTLGQNKARATREALGAVNPDVEVAACPVMLTAENADSLIRGHDLVLDCLDNLPARFVLARHCENWGVVLVHGAVDGFYGQVANIFPGEKLLEAIYARGTDPDTPVDNSPGNPPFIPQLVGALQSCEALKLLAGRAEVLRGSLLHVDMLHNCYETIALL